MCTRGRRLVTFEKSVASHKVSCTHKKASPALQIPRLINSGFRTSGLFKSFFSFFNWCPTCRLGFSGMESLYAFSLINTVFDWYNWNLNNRKEITANTLRFYFFFLASQLQLIVLQEILFRNLVPFLERMSFSFSKRRSNVAVEIRRY